MFAKQLKQDDVMRWLAFGLIALAVLTFYFPSLYYPPRADQVIYLSQTAGKRPVDLIFGCYDYNRHRTIAPGDELLFRPLLFDFLGCEQVLFGHHFWAWQLVELLAHLTLIWVLLRLLWHLSGPWLAFAGTWLFALSVFNYEMVSWPHMSCYIFAMACTVGLIEQAVFCFEENEVPWKRIKRILIYSLIACFMYETANIFVLMITGALIFSFPKMKGRLLWLITPVILYVFFSYYNYTYIDHVIHPAAVIAHRIAIGEYVLAIIRLTFWWLYEGLFNGMYHYILGIRTMFPANEVMVFKPLVFNNPQVILELIILPVFLGLAWIGRRQFLKRSALLIILSGMLFSYVAVIVLGRYHTLEELLDAVRVNTYYSYIFWAFILIIACVAITAQGTKTRLRQWLIIIFVTASLLSGLWQGKKIYDMAVNYSNESNSIVLLVTTLDLLIQEKKAGSNFSFYVDPDYPGNYPYGSIRKITDPPSKEYTFAEFLYPQYFRPRGLAQYNFLARRSSL
jgi:hypothetical protein